MTAGKLPNRWGIAMAAVLMQICLGAVYGWSVFKIPLMRTQQWPETQVQLNFTLAIFFLGVGTIIGMMLITVAIAAPITFSAVRFRIFNRYAGAAAGALSLGFGFFLVYQIGIVDGLFR